MPTKPLNQNMMSKLQQRLTHLNEEFSKVRSGRVSPSLVEHIKVEAYNSQMPLNQVATITTPDPRTLSIEPWDKGLLSAVEKALQVADVGSVPTNDGHVVRLNFPPLSEERRKELIKVVKKLAEESKVAVRQIRREALDHLHKLEKDISKDDIKREEDKIQKSISEFESKITTLVDKKEAELLSV
jgi:ribosome recycling factor